MPASGAAKQDPYLPPRFAPTATLVPVQENVLAALGWAVASSTLHRIRRGEGALLAINLSLIAAHGAVFTVRGVMEAFVSVLAILVMYAFNDLYDAPVDWNNPKKDRALIRTWIEHRQAGVLVTIVLKLVTLAIALPSRAASERVASLDRHIRMASGLASIAFGLFLAHQIGFTDGLFGDAPRWDPK